MAWLQLPKRVLHSLNALACLARVEGPTRVREVARCSGIPPAHAAKILHGLRWAGLVHSRRGPKGGFWLRMAPESIRIKDVLAFLQPRIEEGGNDPVLRVWEEVAASSHRAFEELTLADLTRNGEISQAFTALLRSEGDWPACP